MTRSSRVATLLTAAVLASGVSAAVQKVTRQGRYLYTADNNRFFIKGVAYQPQGNVTQSDDNPFGEPDTFIDALADDAGCARDLPNLQSLGVNVIRAYSVNSTANHDACMQALSQAGIYTIIDLSLPLTGSIDRTQPAWSTNLQDQYLRTIDAFSKYDNVLAYNVGNEVVTVLDDPTAALNATAAAAFIKAAARDVKAYLASKKLDTLVGYAAIDASNDYLVPLASYLSCDPSGSNSGSTSLDLFGLNNYEWCGDAQPSAYDSKNQAFQNYNVAAYFSEFGSVKCPPRLWSEVPTIFSEPMSDIWSGAVAFSYFPASSADGQFGMVTIDGNTATTSDDFNRLKTQYASVSPPNSPSPSSTTTYPTCPTANANFAASSTLPPTPNDAACSCLESTFACRFTPATTNVSGIVGPLLDTACGLLGQNGGSCDAIGADGLKGVYGAVSFCDASTKLSYVIDQFYEKTNRNAQSCDFSGNASVNPSAPSNSAAASAAASSCLSGQPATFTPSAPASTSGGASPSGSSSSGSGSGSGGSGSGSGNNNGALSVFSSQAAWGVALSAAFSVVGGFFVLA